MAAGLLSGTPGIKKGVSHKDLLSRKLKTDPAVVRLYSRTEEQLMGVADPRLAESWLRLNKTDAGRVLLNNARYEIRLKNLGTAGEVAQWLPEAAQPRGWYVSVKSPAHTVEWKWPLRVAVMPDGGFAEAQTAMSRLMRQGPSWAPQLLSWFEKPGDEAGAADILIFPHGQEAMKTLLKAKALVTADLLVLCGVQQEEFGAMAGEAEDLLALTQANAVLLADLGWRDLQWLGAVVEHLSHDEPLDVAVTQALKGPLNMDPRRMMVLATPRFLRQMRLSRFVGSLEKKLATMRDEIEVDTSASPQWRASAFQGRKMAEELSALLREQARTFNFRSERGDASLVSAIAAAVTKVPKPKEREERRLLQERLKALEQTAVPPEKALEAGRKYSLEVRIGPKQKGWSSVRESFPAPPVTPDEAGVSLLIVFEEQNSAPEPQCRTILLPRKGVSSACSFDFKVSAAARLFEGWISVFHNNRWLQEGRIRAAVVGGAGETGQRLDEARRSG